jgi:alpha-galactosidase
MAKVVMIGAGSQVFAGTLTRDILAYEATSDTQFGYVDINATKLELAEQYAQRIIREGNYADASVTATTDRREALKGADYVIISILVGGYDPIETEIDIPMKYGINQCIGDTLTPGGIMRCLRTLPELVAIGDDIAELCPNATVMNYTNPMSMLSWGFMDAHPELSYVGLCHSVQGTAREWARRLHVDMADVNYECAGINHQAWITRYEVKGEDRLPAIRELAFDPEIWSGDSTRMEYLKHFGYPVTESSGHGSEYNWWFRKDDATIERYCDSSVTRWNGLPGYIKRLYDRPDWLESMQKRVTDEKPLNLERGHEYGAQIIHAMETGEREVIYGTVKNHGLIDNLPPDVAVEVPVHVDKNGLQPMHVGALPTQLAAINRAQLLVQELAVRAVQEKDPERVFQAMAMDPLCAMSCTLDQIRAMTRELMEAHREYIPILDGRLPADQKIMYTERTENAEIHIDPGEEG